MAHALDHPRPTRLRTPFAVTITIRNGPPRCPLCGDELNRDAWNVCGDLAGCHTCARLENSEWQRCCNLADQLIHARHFTVACGIIFFTPRDARGNARTIAAIDDLDD